MIALDSAQAPETSTPTTPRPTIQRYQFVRDLFELLIWIGAIYALVNLSTVRFVVDGQSMEPNFHDNDYLIVSRVNYLFGDPQRGDIIVFHYPGDPKEDYIKRVIGTPGDTVEIRDTFVYVNGEQLNEPYINEPCNTYHCANETTVLESDEYFVMGDNRNHSSDSRSFGVVKREYIVGEVMVRYWPFSDWGLVNHINYPGD